MTKAHSFDVLIVGGGPAGTAAAIRCAEAGLKVGLVDERRFPRDKAGETLHPGVEPLLRTLGVWSRVQDAGFLRFAGHWIERAQERVFVPFGRDENGPWFGMQAWRAEFDKILLERAIEAGALCLQSCRATGIRLRAGCLQELHTSGGPMVAPVILDAGGSRQWLASQLGLRTELHSRRLIVYFGYAEIVKPLQCSLPLFIERDDGWTWIAEVRPNIIHWAQLDISSRAAALPAQIMDSTRPIGRTSAADVTWRIASPTASEHFFLLGDAAAVVDPACSHGILRALMSGIYAAHCLTDPTAGNPSARAAQYDAWTRSFFLTDLFSLKSLPYGKVAERSPSR